VFVKKRDTLLREKVSCSRNSLMPELVKVSVGGHTTDRMVAEKKERKREEEQHFQNRGSHFLTCCIRGERSDPGWEEEQASTRQIKAGGKDLQKDY